MQPAEQLARFCRVMWTGPPVLLQFLGYFFKLLAKAVAILPTLGLIVVMSHEYRTDVVQVQSWQDALMWLMDWRKLLLYFLGESISTD